MDKKSITTIGSFFWERISIEHKKFWKSESKRRNIQFNLHGKAKLNGFWIFSNYVIEKLRNNGKIKLNFLLNMSSKLVFLDYLWIETIVHASMLVTYEGCIDDMWNDYHDLLIDEAICFNTNNNSS